MSTFEIERAKERCRYKAYRRGLAFKSRRAPKRSEWRYRVVRLDDGFEVWWADCIEEIEGYLDKRPPSEWQD